MSVVFLLAACLLAGNHYSWAGWDSNWADANNWGSMDYPQEGGSITADEIIGDGTLIVECDLTAGSIQVDTLRIGSPHNAIPEPRAAELILSLILAGAIVFTACYDPQRQ